MTDEYLEAMNDDFKKAMDAFKKELGSVRTGQASPQLLDSRVVHSRALLAAVCRPCQFQEDCLPYRVWPRESRAARATAEMAESGAVHRDI